MRVSETFKLNRTQAELDFVDVDVAGDTRLFIDPQAIRHLPGDWAHTSVAYIQDFFTSVLEAIKDGNDSDAQRLLSGLREPNETHLGLSSGRSRGRALGPESTRNVWEALSKSQAAQSGLLVHLEDTVLLVHGIGPDIVSDITTNLIRLPLIEYTQNMCALYGIPIEPKVWSGPIWDPSTKGWTEGTLVPLPAPGGRRLILTPKSIVRRHLEYDAREYYGDFIIPFLQQAEIAAGTSLVKVLKGRRTKYVTKKSIKEKYGDDKTAIIDLTLQNPQLLEKYKEVKGQAPVHGVDQAAIEEKTGSPEPDWDTLLRAVTNVKSGKAGADAFHKAIERLLSALFSSALTMPHKEYKIHEGRKRIDIFYVNALGGFFGWVAANYPAANVVVECKNYKGDPANPELDQLAGRFAPSRGKFGILVCREFQDKTLFIARCRDTAREDRGFILPLDDSDLTDLVAFAKAGNGSGTYKLLMDRFQQLLI